ncbi:MAG: glycosyltransferase family 4 protein [Verrucomicrobiae bacterium]|nr:glycosyltransferase family 4 protein [Verrucomicrobiae bacterium]
MKSASNRLANTSVLVAHPWMGFGGSEATTVWAVQALQSQGAKVTLFSASPIDLERLNRIYGTSIDVQKLRIRRSPRLPGFANGDSLAHWQNGWFQRQCRRIAHQFDLVISGYNPIDFGRPGIQLIGDYTFDENLRRELDPDSDRLPRHRNHFARRLYLAIGDALRGDRERPIAKREDLMLANSDWTRRIFADHLGIPDCPVVFPPVAYQSATETVDQPRDPLAFVCLGRICPEKRVESAIRILSRVRQAGYPVTLAIAGAFGDPAYGRQIQELVAESGDWVQLTGFLEATARDALLARASFGIHARPAEAFGIAVAELAGSGCVPFVPETGGPAEIVDRSSLRFQTEEEAVAKIISVLSDQTSHEPLRASLSQSMERFRPEQFMNAFLSEVDLFLEHGGQRGISQGSHHGLPTKTAQTEVARA